MVSSAAPKMVSNTQQTKRIRARRLKRMGLKRKRQAQLHGTPVFPIHPPGYDPDAPDAKRKAASRDEG